MTTSRARLRVVLLMSTLALTSAASSLSAAGLQPGVNQWIEANGVSLRYQLTGSGSKTIVFLHAQTVTMEDWDYLYPAFQRGRKLLRYDMRGWGLSEKIKDGVITMDQAVEDLRALLDALNIKEKVVLVGGASGANVGLVFAMKYPERVKAVATFSASINLNPKPRTPPAAGEAPPNASSEASNVDRYAGVYPVELRTDPEKWARFIGMNKAMDPVSGRAWTTMTASYDFVPVLPKITVPTLIVGTSLFPGRTTDFMRQVAQAIPKGEFVEIKSSHFAELESPELAIPVLQAFLKKVGG
jgi:3-oxoadipate enol-lactonase